MYKDSEEEALCQIAISRYPILLQFITMYAFELVQLIAFLSFCFFSS